MKKHKREFLNSRFKAISRVPFLLDSLESEQWDFTVVCRMFVETAGYLSCWIAVVFESGELKSLSQYKKEEFFTVHGKVSDFTIADYVKDSLVHSSDYLIDGDPLLEYLGDASIRDDMQMHSITFKLSFNGIIYGVLSIILPGDYQSVREEVLILSDAVKSISVFLYDVDVQDRIKDIFVIMFETTGNGTALFEDDTTISYVNKEFENLSGYSKEEIEGKMSWTEFVMPEDVERMLEYHRLRRSNPKDAPRNYEFRFIDRHGTIKNIFMTIDMVPRSKISIASFMNITEKKRLESEILRVSELERQQIGSDLHDGLSPHLVGVKLMLRVLEQKVQNSQMPTLEELQNIDRLISDAIEQSRRLIKGLKPVDIEPEGLLFALEELVGRTCTQYGLQCTLEYDGPVTINNNIAATHLYYIVQEAINNAIKHAGPRRIEVVIGHSDHVLSVEIRDDGVGIPALLDTTKGMGLNLMKYRASLINGEIMIKRLTEGGTSVRCTLRM
ncbi:MAG: PAS domain S-box protein [Spirochaetes bacterium]|nr:PAS domain S-box protein [Spirochaetota bacterium]